MPSPTCTVNATATPGGVSVTAASTPSIALVSAAGVTTWSISCIYTDETNTASAINATLSVDSVAKTATFTAPALGSALIFRSVINGGVDANGAVQASYTTTFKVNVLTGSSKKVAAFGETTENDASFGWAPILNDLIRNGTGGAAPTGTGFVHITGGAQDAAAQLVVNADVNAAAAIAGTKISPDFGSQNIVTTGAASVGTTPATAGTCRLPNAGTIQFRNAANGANLQALSIDGSNICQVGNATGATTITGSTVGVTGATTVTGAITGTSTLKLGTNAASSGTIMLPNLGDIQFRNTANSANLRAATIDTDDKLTIGNATGETALVGSIISATGNTTVTGTITGTSTLKVGSNAATSGTIMLPNACTIQGRNQPNNANLQMLALNTGNQVEVANASGTTLMRGATIEIQSGGHTYTYGATTKASYFATSSAEVTADRWSFNQIESIQTTDATVTSLWTLAATASSVQYVEAKVSAVLSTGASARVWKIACAYYGSTPTKLGSHVVLEDYSDATSAAWALDFDTSGGSIRLRATGVAATTIRWTALVNVVRSKN